MLTAAVVFAVLVLVAMMARAAAELRHDAELRADPARRLPAPRRGDTGRAVLRSMRAVNDVRAIARGPGAYGRPGAWPLGRPRWRRARWCRPATWRY